MPQAQLFPLLRREVQRLLNGYIQISALDTPKSMTTLRAEDPGSSDPRG